jgi:23S rRNA (cytosine1962-C5)-methyltransferase
MELLITEKSEGYELLDSGEGRKLERVGGYVLSRPEPQAIWKPALPEEEWASADAVFLRSGKTGTWKIRKGLEIPEIFRARIFGTDFSLKLLSSKHLGVFPEQSENWKWLGETIGKAVKSGEKISVLNLFAYTGGATIAAAKAGAEVCHVDSSQFVVDIAKKNLENSGLAGAPARFIVDDVRKFVKREARRGKKYDVVLLDPPVYGKATNKSGRGKAWDLETDLLPLLSQLKKVLSPKPLAVILNGYASGLSHVSYKQALESLTHDLVGTTVSGELAIKDASGRLLPSGIFARFERRT